MAVSISVGIFLHPCLDLAHPNRPDPEAVGPHGYRLVGNKWNSKTLVMAADARVAELLALLTSPYAILSPGPPEPPFPCFVFRYHTINVNGPEYRAAFHGDPGLHGAITNRPQSSQRVQHSRSWLPQVNIPAPQALTWTTATQSRSPGFVSCVLCALPIRKLGYSDTEESRGS